MPNSIRRSHRDQILLRVGEDVVGGSVGICLLLDDARGCDLRADVCVLVVRQLGQRRRPLVAAAGSATSASNVA